jgi:hypothetical protein
MRTFTVWTAALAATLALAGCASTSSQEQPASSLSPRLEQAAQWAGDHGGPVAAIVGGLMMLDDLKMLEAEYIAGGLVAFAIYDPLAPTWRVAVSEAGSDRIRLALRMKSVSTGGGGEARLVFLRNARQMVEAGGFAGYEILHYEEGIESTRPFAHRYANAEIQLLRSRIFPAL